MRAACVVHVATSRSAIRGTLHTVMHVVNSLHVEEMYSMIQRLAAAHMVACALGLRWRGLEALRSVWGRPCQYIQWSGGDARKRVCRPRLQRVHGR